MLFSKVSPSSRRNNTGVDIHQKYVIRIAKKWHFLISCLPKNTEWSYNQTSFTFFTSLEHLPQITFSFPSKFPYFCLSKLQLFYHKWSIFFPSECRPRVVIRILNHIPKQTLKIFYLLYLFLKNSFLKKSFPIQKL